MGDDGDFGTGISGGDVLPGSIGPCLQVEPGFTLREGIAVHIGTITGVYSGIAGFGLVGSQPLEKAEVEFPQAGVEVDGEAQRFGDDRGGLPGAWQVAAVNGIDRSPSQVHGQLARLRVTRRVQRHRREALPAILDIPVRFTMTNQQDAFDFHVRSCVDLTHRASGGTIRDDISVAL